MSDHLDDLDNAVQPDNSDASGGKDRNTEKFHSLFYKGMITQLFFVLLAALILDGGRMLRVECAFAISYFVMVLWIGIDRPDKVTSGDAFFIRFIPIFTFVVAMCM